MCFLTSTKCVRIVVDAQDVAHVPGGRVVGATFSLAVVHFAVGVFALGQLFAAELMGAFGLSGRDRNFDDFRDDT